MNHLPASWLDAIRDWAAHWPRIAAVYAYGSRVKGTHRPDSDVDIAIILSEGDGESAITIAMFEGQEMRASLEPLISAPLHLEFAFPNDDVVMPAVLDHGVLIFRR